MSSYSCSDRMCGAEDCNRCYPGNQYGKQCEECGEDYEECPCDEFEAADDSDYDGEDDDDQYDQAREDELCDKAADEWENGFWDQG